MAYKIVLIPGGGIGREVVPEWVRTMGGAGQEIRLSSLFFGVSLFLYTTSKTAP